MTSNQRARVGPAPHRVSANPLLVSVIGAALLSLQIGVAAQTTSDQTARMPANKGTMQNAPAEAVLQPSPKMSQQSPANTSSPQSQQNQAISQTPNQATSQGQGGMANQSTSQSAGAMQNQVGTSGDKAASNTAGGKKARSTSSKSTLTQEQAALSPDERAYRDALKQCAMQSDTSQRDTCLDGAIQRFGKSS